MKNKILILLLLLGGVFGFAFTSLQAQAEFVDDNTFVISNSTYDINEEDIKQMFLFFRDYIDTYDLLIEDEFDGHYADIGNNLYDGLNIDFDADLLSLNYDLFIIVNSDNNEYGIELVDYKHELTFSVFWLIDTNEIDIRAMATYAFNVVINLPPPPPITIYSSLHGVINFFVQPFLDLITDIGVGDNTISLGFGSIEWFNFTLLELSNLVLSFLVIWIFLKLIFKLLKLVVRIITGGAINV